MSSAEQFLKIARSQLGYKEGPNNDTKYGAWYGMNHQPWCAMFVSWCADRAGLLGSIIPKFAYVPYGVDFFRKRGEYHPRGSYRPQPGDLVFFGDQSHVGIVEAVNGEQLLSIEGNASATGNSSNGDGVYRRSRSLNHAWIMGYGHPNFPKEDENMESKELQIRDLDRGKMISVRAVNIGGENYIRLRDTEKLFPVLVSYDASGGYPEFRLNYQ